MVSREPAFREYTSPAFGDGKIFYFGGGHSGYFGNDVEIYDPAANAWRQCYRAVCPPKEDSTQTVNVILAAVLALSWES
jgi:hypothetical protein